MNKELEFLKISTNLDFSSVDLLSQIQKRN